MNRRDQREKDRRDAVDDHGQDVLEAVETLYAVGQEIVSRAIMMIPGLLRSSRRRSRWHKSVIVSGSAIGSACR